MGQRYYKNRIWQGQGEPDLNVKINHLLYVFFLSSIIYEENYQNYLTRESPKMMLVNFDEIEICCRVSVHNYACQSNLSNDPKFLRYWRLKFSLQFRYLRDDKMFESLTASC